MEKAKNVANNVIQGGMAGYTTGRMIGQGVGAAHNAAQRIPAYRRATEASAVGRYYSRQMPRDTGGPRTAGFYQYRYGLGGADGPSVGTDAQRALLQEQRAVQTHLDNLTRAPRQAAFHNENPMLPDMSGFDPLHGRRRKQRPRCARRAGTSVRCASTGAKAFHNPGVNITVHGR